ncbi:UDP-N-acetylglucosamine 2-epimerase [Devosia ginsengisoli]|uniref:UDP-N-acetylglucosamine 2-epimerase (Hydrolyzing) n=1 Tax=Devosia ginsengisoli TaxID=400770 RepID=A0A5B8LVK0_9HYPH|nr:UDP-N-acetylglucosamine 2-epimerase [Devosia ginsengisoli]QDZ11634.1 UDP-N-acetylglucosamine 2-epimerase (hydrolyzing) [Devosia ginsengisoli]
MNQCRRICYISGTRADYGLMQACLQQIDACPDLELGIIATGMHLSPMFGMTVGDIERAGLPIVARIPVADGKLDGAGMAGNIAVMMTGIVAALQVFKPDAVLLLGDRGEMIAAALAAIHLNIPIFHIHGGERSGTVDEPVRHAISKLSDVHLVATEESADRLVRMGERADRVHVVGAPGLDGIVELASEPAESLLPRYGLDPQRELALLLYHPVLQEAEAGAGVVDVLIAELSEQDTQVLAFRPNSDAGSAPILAALDAAEKAGRVKLVTHAPRNDYLALLRHARMLLGNSSSGIIEAATFGTSVVNVGSRQMLRQRNSNVIDVLPFPAAIRVAITEARSQSRRTSNVFGDGQAAPRIVRYLRETPLDQILGKVNVY